MKSYFGYIRVSTVRQGERGTSLAEQRAAIEAFARLYGYKIIAWFVERETAAKQGRAEFNRLLSELKKGRASGVIIHKIDRSARNLRDWARLGELMDRGLEVHFAGDNLDLTTRGGRLSADIQAVVAADFIRNLSDEVRKGIYGRLRQGFYPHKAPPGYVNCGGGARKEIDPVTGPLVRQAFELYGSGSISLRDLRTMMAERGMTTGRGAPLPVNHWSYMLHNPFYIGLMRVKRTGETFEGNHDPLIPPALFERVQNILSGRLYPRVEIHRFLFRRLIKCSACGRSLTGERQKGHVYYRCHGYACRGASVSETAVDQALRQELETLRLDDVDARDFRDVLKSLSTSAARVAAEERTRRAQELALIQQRLDRLLDTLLDGILDKETYEARRGVLLQRKAALAQDAEAGEPFDPLQVVSECFETAMAVQQTYELGSDDQKRRLIETLSSNLLVDGKEIVFPMLSPFAELREWSIQNESWAHRGAVRTTTRDKRLVKLRDFLLSLVETVAGIHTSGNGPTTGASAGRPHPRPPLPESDAGGAGGSARAA